MVGGWGRKDKKNKKWLEGGNGWKKSWLMGKKAKNMAKKAIKSGKKNGKIVVKCIKCISKSIMIPVG